MQASLFHKHRVSHPCVVCHGSRLCGRDSLPECPEGLGQYHYIWTARCQYWALYCRRTREVEHRLLLVTDIWLSGADSGGSPAALHVQRAVRWRPLGARSYLEPLQYIVRDAIQRPLYFLIFMTKASGSRSKPSFCGHLKGRRRFPVGWRNPRFGPSTPHLSLQTSNPLLSKCLQHSSFAQCVLSTHSWYAAPHGLCRCRTTPQRRC